MKKIFAISIILCALCFQNTKAQELMKDPTPAEKNDLSDIYIYDRIDKMPEFPGGISEFRKYVVNNFNFPDELTQSIRFTIWFIVEKDGSLSSVKLLNDPGFGIGDQIKKIFATSPKWNPGYDKGKPVRSKFQFPFALQFE